MLKRTIYIGSPSVLKLKQSQLVISEPETRDIKGTIPIEDISVLVLDDSQITITGALISKLMENTVALVHCDRAHLPNGLMLPLQGHSTLTQRWRYQIEASIPLKKQLWKQVVQAKIQNQSSLLNQYKKNTDEMSLYSEQVTPGDESNIEGLAAKYYWKHLLPDFRRAREGKEPNNLLNFGYAILRSIVARAIVSTGLLPALGIYHKNKYNPYCLADDLMEPLRPSVDELVLSWLQSGYKPILDTEAKKHLVGISTVDVEIEEKTRPLAVAVSTMTASLHHCYSGERRKLSLPKMRGNNEQ